MFPEMAERNLIRVINGSTGTALMQAIQGGDCAGGIAPDVHVRYALGPADPGCALSGVTPIGQNLNTGFEHRDTVLGRFAGRVDSEKSTHRRLGNPEALRRLCRVDSPSLPPSSPRYYAIPFGLHSQQASEEFVLALGYLLVIPLQSNACACFWTASVPSPSFLLNVRQQSADRLYSLLRRPKVRRHAVSAKLEALCLHPDGRRVGVGSVRRLLGAHRAVAAAQAARNGRYVQWLPFNRCYGKESVPWRDGQGLSFVY